MKVIFHREFSAAHRLQDDPSPCVRIHGHNYVVDVEIETNAEGTMVVPHSVVKHSIDQFDHRLILEENDPFLWGTPDVAAHIGVVRVPGAPTTEFLAQYLAEEIANEAQAWRRDQNQDPGFIDVTVTLRETKSISAVGHIEVSAWAP